MFKQFKDKIAFSGITVLITGVALLIFTFASAYGFLTQSLSIITSQDLVQTFGATLSPLIATCIRIMYLGIMGWIGSLLTIRGITVITHLPDMTTAARQEAMQPEKAEDKKPIKEPAKPVSQPSEPEFMVIPPAQTVKTEVENPNREKSKPNSSD
jgi:hypothetical protein